jgi:hypothetical protein
MKRMVLVWMALGPAMARADSQAVKEIDPSTRSRISLTLGLFTPTGELGGEYTQALLPGLEIGAGAGAGGFGPQASLMPRLRTAVAIQRSLSAWVFRAVHTASPGASWFLAGRARARR